MRFSWPDPTGLGAFFGLGLVGLVGLVGWVVEWLLVLVVVLVYLGDMSQDERERERERDSVVSGSPLKTAPFLDINFSCEHIL